MNPDDPLGLIKPVESADPLGLKSARPAPGSINKLGLAQRIAAAPHPEDMEDATPPSYMQQALGGLAAFNASIPGMEAMQATMRSLVRRQPYTEALSDIRSAEESAGGVATLNKMTGTAIAALATPGSSAAMQGGVFGAASGLLKADPASLGDRVGAGAKEAAVDALFGKVAGEVVPNFLRSKLSTSLGKASLARDATIKAINNAKYGKAAAEGAGLTHADVTAAMDSPDIKPYADAIRNSSTFKGADDATVLNETYKLLSERQGTLGTRMAASTDFKAGTSLEKGEITAAKKTLLDAADKIMPSYRDAVSTASQMARQRDAFRAAADATSRIVKGTPVAGKKLSQNSPEAFRSSIERMTPEEAKAALDGVMGRLKNSGIFSAIKGGAAKVAPYVNALDRQAGNQLGTAARGFGIDLGAQANN